MNATPDAEDPTPERDCILWRPPRGGVGSPSRALSSGEAGGRTSARRHHLARRNSPSKFALVADAISSSVTPRSSARTSAVLRTNAGSHVLPR